MRYSVRHALQRTACATAYGMRYRVRHALSMEQTADLLGDVDKEGEHKGGRLAGAGLGDANLTGETPVSVWERIFASGSIASGIIASRFITILDLTMRDTRQCRV